MSDQPKPTTGAPPCVFCGRQPHDDRDHSYRPPEPKPTVKQVIKERANLEIDYPVAVKPKPTTGEWTGDYVANKFKINAWDVCDKIADAHNAALDAAGHANIRTNEMLTNVRRERDEVARQLDDEREKFRKAKEWNQVAELELGNVRSLHNEMMSDMARLSNELAAERDALEVAQTYAKSVNNVNDQLRDQLDAAHKQYEELTVASVDKIKTLVDALTCSIEAMTWAERSFQSEHDGTGNLLRAALKESIDVLAKVKQSISGQDTTSSA